MSKITQQGGAMLASNAIVPVNGVSYYLTS
jgi:hypothetical protein